MTKRIPEPQAMRTTWTTARSWNHAIIDITKVWTRRRVEPHLKLLDKLEEYFIAADWTNSIYAIKEEYMRLKKIRHILPRYHVLLTQITLPDIPVQ